MGAMVDIDSNLKNPNTLGHESGGAFDRQRLENIQTTLIRNNMSIKRSPFRYTFYVRLVAADRIGRTSNMTQDFIPAETLECSTCA